MCFSCLLQWFFRGLSQASIVGSINAKYTTICMGSTLERSNTKHHCVLTTVSCQRTGMNEFAVKASDTDMNVLTVVTSMGKGVLRLGAIFSLALRYGHVSSPGTLKMNPDCSNQQVLNPTPVNPTPATWHKRKRKRCNFRKVALQELHCNIRFSAVRT